MSCRARRSLTHRLRRKLQRERGELPPTINVHLRIDGREIAKATSKIAEQSSGLL